MSLEKNWEPLEVNLQGIWWWNDWENLQFDSLASLQVAFLEQNWDHTNVVMWHIGWTQHFGLSKLGNLQELMQWNLWDSWLENVQAFKEVNLQVPKFKNMQGSQWAETLDCQTVDPLECCPPPVGLGQSAGTKVGDFGGSVKGLQAGEFAGF